MPRPIWIEYAGAVYHVTARGNERKAVFSDGGDADDDGDVDQGDFAAFQRYVSGQNVPADVTCAA